jgi:hypothetical protein
MLMVEGGLYQIELTVLCLNGGSFENPLLNGDNSYEIELMVSCLQMIK